MPFSVRYPALALLLLVVAAAAADEPKKEKPATFTLVNQAKDIRVLSDRDEPILDYFHRHRVLVGGVLPEGLTKLLEAKEPLTRFFVSYASQNDDPARGSTFGATLEIEPPSEAITKLLNEHKPDGKKTLSLTLLFRRDEKKPGLYHVAGWTERTPVGFFDNDKKNAADGFSQKDLCWKGEPKK